MERSRPLGKVLSDDHLSLVPREILRKFGYGDNLELQESFLHPNIAVPAHNFTELSALGYKFFTSAFKQYDKDADGALSPSELAELFSTAPRQPWLDIPFPNTTVVNDKGYVSLQGFLAQWR